MCLQNVEFLLFRSCMKVASFVDRSMSIGVALWSMNSSVMLNCQQMD